MTVTAGAGLIALLLVGRDAPAQTDEERELEAVRARISTLEERLEKETAERSRAVAALRDVELDIAAARQAVQRIEAETRVEQQEAEALKRRRAAAAERVAGEQAALAEQIRITYINGSAERLKLLLSQENPADFGRMSVYYDYFNRSRARRIRTVAAELDAIEALEAEAARVAAGLEALGAAREAELAALDRSLDERRALIAELDASIEEGGGEIERLHDEERRLVDLVTELGELLAAYPVNSEEPFPNLKGRLAWPVPGEIIGEYGKPRGGDLVWNGVLIAADAGTEVRSVYHGRVEVADWLQGLGLLMVINHGDGYMSLYGHNDALLKEPGDWVRPGEAIAEVGASGGRGTPALYFEIRHGIDPVDPHAWIAN